MPVVHRIEHVRTIAEMRSRARRRAPRPVFDYVDGAAGDGEHSLNRARAAFRRVQFHPDPTGEPSSAVTNETVILGQRSAQPFALAPVGLCRMLHTEGERAVAEAAQTAGIPCTLSTVGSVTLEQFALAGPRARRWFQLYMWRDRAAMSAVLRRAAACGVDTVILTVDTPVGGARLRDIRNGLTMPPRLGLRTFASGARHPSWTLDLLTTDPPRFATLDVGNRTPQEALTSVFDPSLTVADLDWLRARWSGTLLVKGVLSASDATRVVDCGADGVVVSNHGGRQLDRAPVPLERIAGIRDALPGNAAILLDSGITTGAAVIAALAQGADAVLIGRAYAYGLMAGGVAGVSRAIEILAGEVTATLSLLGVRTVDELRRGHVSGIHL